MCIINGEKKHCFQSCCENNCCKLSFTISTNSSLLKYNTISVSKVKFNTQAYPITLYKQMQKSFKTTSSTTPKKINNSFIMKAITSSYLQLKSNALKSENKWDHITILIVFIILILLLFLMSYLRFIYKEKFRNSFNQIYFIIYSK
jgi:hypothetical protein